MRRRIFLLLVHSPIAATVPRQSQEPGTSDVEQRGDSNEWPVGVPAKSVAALSVTLQCHPEVKCL